MRINPKVKEFKKREQPINYSNILVTASGKLEERSALLDKRIVEGYAVIWSSVNSYGERFVKGAFGKSISENGPDSKSAYKIKFRDEHGRSCSLFAELIEDEIGLYFKTVPLDNVQWCNDLLVQLKSGTINNFSIGFKHLWDRIEWDDENDIMINLEAKLYEISAVSIPSDTETYAIRSVEEKEYLEEDVEDFINDLPRSKQLEARKIFTRCMLPINQEPIIQKRKSPVSDTPVEAGLDYDYLIKNLS